MKVVHVLTVGQMGVSVHLKMLCPFFVKVIVEVGSEIWRVCGEIHLSGGLVDVFLLVDSAWDHVVVGGLLEALGQVGLARHEGFFLP